jgi:hypothetical protein
MIVTSLYDHAARVRSYEIVRSFEISRADAK